MLIEIKNFLLDSGPKKQYGMNLAISNITLKFPNNLKQMLICIVSELI